MKNSGWKNITELVLNLVTYGCLAALAIIFIVRGYIHYAMIVICFLVMLFLINHVDTNGQG